MRSLLPLLALVALVVPLAGCCGDLPTAEVRAPALSIPPPLSFRNEPKFVPSGYVQVVPQQVAPQANPVPMYAPPAAAASCAPAAGYTPGYQYAAPPVPQAPRAAGCP